MRCHGIKLYRLWHAFSIPDYGRVTSRLQPRAATSLHSEAHGEPEGRTASACIKATKSVRSKSTSLGGEPVGWRRRVALLLHRLDVPQLHLGRSFPDLLPGVASAIANERLAAVHLPVAPLALFVVAHDEGLVERGIELGNLVATREGERVRVSASGRRTIES